MAIIAALRHKTIYQYDRPIVLGPQVVRLRPAPHTRIPIQSYSLKVGPDPHFLNWQQDPFGNWLARCVFPEKVSALRIEVDLNFEHAVFNPFDFFLEPYAEHFPFAYEPDLKRDLAPYLKASKTGSEFARYVADLPRGAPTVPFLVALNQKLASDVFYLIRMEPGVQTPDETLRLRAGSCRDTSWLLVQIARQLGLAARFVSGYLVQLKADLKALDGPSGTDRDVTDLHAWAEIYLPGAGWVGLDPTSGLLCGEGHIPLAAAPHFQSAAPITGMAEPAGVAFDFEMSLTRLAEAPRITAPFTDDAWEALNALGEEIDADLVKHDVRLTMGGEPTFVSIDDFQSPEWNTEASGPTKRARADTLIRILREEYAPHGLLHYGQGKWYPGEVLPRWAFGLFWRLDGEPIWRKPALAASEVALGGADTGNAEPFARDLARRLGVGVKAVQPVFEDGEYWERQRSLLPENARDDPSEKTQAAYARVTGIFARGLEAPAAYLIPVRRAQRAHLRQGWISETWSTRSDRMVLVPGDSPAGWRLPLDALPYLSPDVYPYIVARDADDHAAALPSRADLSAAYESAEADAAPKFVTANPHVRTSLVIEVRSGVLHVFMPPVEAVEDYLELLAAIEASAEFAGAPIRIEGYEPPRDARIQVLKLTPDPGVIEVNIQPASNWAQCVATTRTLYEGARLSRLRADKFMIDGRHTGTGGGNHVVVGGARVEDSPFLRRPDLLKSMLLYWQRHPSLSYMFSGLFIGPSSQAPRIDEARHDALYELEIAMSAMVQSETPPPPWLVDRLLRNLLTDSTGNTHRTEICIDKLYSPDGPTGRLGLVEFRGFEMPPDARMSLAQQLLLRALIAWFWRVPQSGRMMRWGTALADRFMLSQFVWEDFLDVIGDLRAAGYALDPKWFEAQREFRFPFYGAVTRSGVGLELRQALEAWHVMGEEGAPGGATRYVDSSVERLEVRVQGVDAERHQVLCNGRPVPLARTSEAGLLVAGVRFKAWKPASGLHPNIPVQAPLTFDIFDSWSGRSLGGCVYHVAHPAGRNYETFPVNGNEAEARRLARFVEIGHSGGPLAPKPTRPNPDFAVTLDLRRGEDV